jgi:acyl-CoA thioester hydrolase
MVVYKGVCHPALCDVMGHMTTRHYIAMFDDGSYHFLHALFGWSGEQASIDKKGWADVRHIIDYQAEVAAGDLLEIDAQLVKVGNKSMAVEYQMRNISRNQLSASLHSTSVYFDLETRSAIPITAEMREAAKAFLAD